MLRKVGMLQRRSGARDDFGGAPDIWTDVFPVRFGIQMLGGRIIDSGGNERAMSNVTISMRFRPGILPGMRIRADATPTDEPIFYNITATNDVNGLHHELELTAIEDRTASE